MQACDRDRDTSGPGGSTASDTVWTDGDLAEWQSVESAAAEEVGDVPPESAVDLGPVALRDDGRYLHLLLDLGRPVTAQGMVGSVEIALDVDGDGDSGAGIGSVAGVDLVVVLSRHDGVSLVEGVGAGVAIRRVGAAGMGSNESSYPLGLLVAPTHSADRFEVRLRRGVVAGADGQIIAADSDLAVSGIVRYVEGDRVIDETPVFAHVTTASAAGDAPFLGIESLARPEGAYRVVSWNVSDGNFQQRPAAFQRVYRALAPDVVLMDEVYGDVTSQDLATFFDGIPAVAGGWRWWLGVGGGRQRTVVAASGRDVQGEVTLARIDYSPGALDEWAADGGAGVAGLARLEAQRGLSATGAWVRFGPRDVLFVPVDFQSAGHDGSPRDRLREIQAETLNRALDRVLAARDSVGLVIGGDLNLVGSPRPLERLRTGLGEEGGELHVARPVRLRDRSLATWRSTGAADAFSPGRLDYVLYRGSTLTVVNAFVFDVADLTEDARTRLGLDADDTRVTSDHLPVVVDFALQPPESERPGS